MKQFTIGIKILLTILLILNLVFLFAASASSHNVPAKTYFCIGLSIFISFSLLLITNNWRRRIKKKERLN